MTQADIAKVLEVHESTVSRALKDKIILVGSQVYPSSYLFKEGVGGALNQGEIIKIIKGIIENEPKDKPYSDAKIARELALMNIEISRRTVSKYRDLANIGDSSFRKK